MSGYDRHLKAARVVNEAGGSLVGRTRLQKVVYLAQLAGFGDDFSFEYRHYGPYSDDLATGMEIAAGVGIVQEQENRAEWGGRYSTYSATARTPQSEDARRAAFIQAATRISPIELELAATAAFLDRNGWYGRNEGDDPWQETARRKPDKAGGGRLDRAKVAYRGLLAIETPIPLPRIA
jgi:uncharacterized protein YwgA